MKKEYYIRITKHQTSLVKITGNGVRDAKKKVMEMEKKNQIAWNENGEMAISIEDATDDIRSFIDINGEDEVAVDDKTIDEMDKEFFEIEMKKKEEELKESVFDDSWAFDEEGNENYRPMKM